MTTKKKSKKPRTGRILTLPPTRLAPRSADLRSGAFRGAFEYLPGRRPAHRSSVKKMRLEVFFRCPDSRQPGRSDRCKIGIDRSKPLDLNVAEADRIVVPGE